MHGPTLEQMDADYQLLLARRRADRCCPSSPAWDAAIEAVHECEQRISVVGGDATIRLPWRDPMVLRTER